MNRSQGNLQDAFLNCARKEAVTIEITLLDGAKVSGIIKAFDAFTVLVEGTGQPAQLIYKHAMARLVPSRPMRVWTDSLAATAAAAEQTANES